MTPSATESTTARETAAWAGPNNCTACVAPLIVTLLLMTVSGLAGRLGVTTASRLVCPSDSLTKAWANAAPTGPFFDPSSKSIWATSLPSPTRASPVARVMAMSESSLSCRMVTAMNATLAHSRLSGDLLAQQVQLACVLEVSAAKPGNITPLHDFADATYADMVRSALALGPVFARGRVLQRSVGELIVDGVQATGEVAGANTNLGIVLLFAPLVRAAVARRRDEALRAAVDRTLAGLGVDDGAAAFAASARDTPGGLGDAPAP